jgi:hypothetical protein
LFTVNSTSSPPAITILAPIWSPISRKFGDRRREGLGKGGKGGKIVSEERCFNFFSHAIRVAEDIDHELQPIFRVEEGSLKLSGRSSRSAQFIH